MQQEIKDQIKLVIWDLDETLWDGTLAEGEVNLLPGRREVINTLVDRGIMNSIASKNDYDKAKVKLEEFELFNLFIFPSVAFEAKGENVTEIIKQAKLRAQNTLFVDDNTFNRKEVEFYNPGIHTVDPSFFDVEWTACQGLIGKNDNKRSRLRQYKEMEIRASVKKSTSSNDEFLRQSNIVIDIRRDCVAQENRILEMINRTNQLNYTKKRCELDTLHSELIDSGNESAYIVAKDDFGNYGIIGFYMLRDNEVIHFLFSCRVLGLGIEQYVYKKLGCPQVKVVGEVAVELSDTDVDWICEGVVREDSGEKVESGILMIGGCDLESMKYYIDDKCNISTEFSTVIDGKPVKRSYLSQILAQKRYDINILKSLCAEIPFLDMDISFTSKVYSDENRVIVISLVDDYICRVFKKQTDNRIVVSIGNYLEKGNDDVLFERYGKIEMGHFFSDYMEVGPKSAESFYDDLRELIGYIDHSVKIILVNGIDLDVSEWVGVEMVKRNLEMNAVIDRVVDEYDNVQLLDMRELVKTRMDLPNNDNRHFSRSVYYQMAKKMQEMIGVFASDIITPDRVVDNIEKLREVCLSGAIICYGAGKYGMRLAAWIEKNVGEKPVFADSNINEDKVNDKWDIIKPVNIPKDSCVLISVSSKYEREVLSELSIIKHSNYYSISDKCWSALIK